MPQSLGDMARANRAKKHASSSTVKLDDDSMPHSSAPSAGSEAEAARKPDDKSAEAKDADQKDAKKDSAEAQKQKNDELQKQIESEKKEVATLQRELDIAQREARLRAAAFYGDAGTMLRDQAKFAEDTRKAAGRDQRQEAGAGRRAAKTGRPAGTGPQGRNAQRIAQG